MRGLPTSTCSAFSPDTLNLNVTERKIGATVEVSVDEGQSLQTWAISEDGIWLCMIPEEGTEAASKISPKIYEDKANVLSIKDVAYGVKPGWARNVPTRASSTRSRS